MRPGVWYLILATTYLGLALWSLYFACTMYVTVKDAICESARFVDTVNIGKESSEIEEKA